MQFRSLLVVACALALSVTKAAAVPEPEIGRTDIRFYQVAEGFLPIDVDANGFPRGSGFARPNRWGQYTAYLMATNGEGQRTWRVEHLSPAPPGSTVGQASTMYLVEGRDRALLIDTASPATRQLGVNDLKTVVRHLLSHENTGRRRARPLDFVVANTHSHPDHIGENALMADRTIYYPDGDWPQDAPANYVPVREGGGATDHGVAAATIDLGGRVLEAIDMPPHTDGSTGYLDRANKLLFTGDAIGSAWPFLQAASLDVYARTARHLEEVTRSIPDIVILPAHFYQLTAWGRDAAPISGRPLDRQYVLDQLALSEGILRGELDGEPFFWNPGTYWAGLGSARLVYALDRVTTTGANDIASYHAARLRTGYARPNQKPKN